MAEIYLPTFKPRARPRSEHKVREIMKRREVYFVRAQTLGLIKIGTANFAAERLAVLKTASPDALELLGVVFCDNYGSLEAELHSRFWASRSHGEWFRPTPDLIEYIAANAQPPRTHSDVAASSATEPNEWDALAS